MQGEFIKQIPLVTNRIIRLLQDNPAQILPPGADMLCSDFSETCIWVGCQKGLVLCVNYKLDILASLELPGFEFTACSQITFKPKQAIFGSSSGRLFNVRQSS
jgi:hypothetical protein